MKTTRVVFRVKLKMIVKKEINKHRIIKSHRGNWNISSMVSLYAALIRINWY